MMANSTTSAPSHDGKRRRSSVSRSKPEELETGGLDYGRLVDVLLPDVLLAPASFFAADSSWGRHGEAMGGPGSSTGSLSFSRVYTAASRLARKLIAPGAFSSASYPVRKAIVDEKAAVTAVTKTSGLSSSISPPQSTSVLGVIQRNAFDDEPEASEPFPFKPTPSRVLSFVDLLLPIETVKEVVPIVDPRLLQTWSTFFVLEGAGAAGRKKMGRGISIVVRAVDDLKEEVNADLEGTEVVLNSLIEIPVCYPATLERLSGNPALPAASHEVVSSSMLLSSFILSLHTAKLQRSKAGHAQDFKTRMALEGSMRRTRAKEWSSAQSSALRATNQARHHEQTMGQKLITLTSVLPNALVSKAPTPQPRSAFSLEALLLEMWIREARTAEHQCSLLARQAGRKLLLMARCEPESEQSESIDENQMGTVARLLDQIALFDGAGSSGETGIIHLSSLSSPLSFFSVLIRSFAHEQSINSLSHVALRVSPLNPASTRAGVFITSIGDAQSNSGSLQYGHGFLIRGSQVDQNTLSEARFCFEDGDESDECFLRSARPNLPCSPLPDLILMPVFTDPSSSSSVVLPHLRRGRKEAIDKVQPSANHDSIVRAPLKVADHAAISVIVDSRHQDLSDISPLIHIH